MTDLLEADTSWRTEAACLGATDTMYPERGNHDAVAVAIGICIACPVLEPCQQAAAQEPALWRHDGGGIVGGLTGRERRLLGVAGRERIAAGETVAPTPRKIRVKKPAGDACGDQRNTRAGYHRHWKAGEWACPECLEAANRRSREYRAQRRQEKAVS